MSSLTTDKEEICMFLDVVERKKNFTHKTDSVQYKRNGTKTIKKKVTPKNR